MLRQQDEDVLDKIVKNIEDFLLKNKITFKILEERLLTRYGKNEIQSVNFSQLSDIMTPTILVNDVKTCYSVLGLLHQVYSYVPRKV